MIYVRDARDCAAATVSPPVPIVPETKNTALYQARRRNCGSCDEKEGAARTFHGSGHRLVLDEVRVHRVVKWCLPQRVAAFAVDPTTAPRLS